MREILFRGNADGKWVEGQLVYETTTTPPTPIIVCGEAEWVDGNEWKIPDWYSVDPSTVGQYTGLTDEKETRIFEGDVIKVKWGDDYQYRYVCYENGLFKARTKPDSYGGFFSVSLVSFAGFNNPELHCEVVGNVFENDDLLKSEVRTC